MKEKEIILENIKILNLEDSKKIILRSRFYQLISKYKRYSKFYLIFFDAGRLVVTIGSISVPAILSIDKDCNNNIVFWIVWGISLLVSIINGYITLFKFDKKYYSNIAILERLSCEFWQYMALCGRYSGNYTSSIPTHENQFIFFINNIERYEIRNIEEIYITISENGNENKKQTFDDKKVNEVVPSVTKKFIKDNIDTMEETQKIVVIE